LDPSAIDRIWRNADTLIQASVNDSPRSWHVRQMYADMLFDERRPPALLALAIERLRPQ